MTDVAQNPAVVAVTTEISTLEERTATYAVSTIEQFNTGASDLARVKGMQKKLEDTRTAITGPMNEALKRVNEFFRTPATRLKAIEDKIKGALVIFDNEQRRLAREEQARADEAARKEREKIAEQARKAEAAGKTEKAAQLEQRAATVVAPVITRAPPKVSGLQLRDAWKFEVTDLAKVPREYLVVDETKIRKVVQALKGDTQIAGVRVYSEKVAASSAA